MDGSITYDSVEKKISVMELSGCALEPRSVKDMTKQGDVYVFTIRRKQEDGQFQNQNLCNIATDVFLLCGCDWCQQRQSLRFQNNSDDDDDYDDGDDNDSLRFWT